MEISEKSLQGNTLSSSKIAIDEMGQEVFEESCMKWDLPLSEIYKLAMKFYKGEKVKNENREKGKRQQKVFCLASP